ncbi:MAG: 3-oxoacyl-[acyl-carrier-protein] synthase III C-terminal domain-containing protein [Kofleriaceae bacterium]
MSADIPIYVHSVSYELGEIVEPISEIPDLKEDTVSLESFLALGLSELRRTDRVPAELARACCERSLQAARLRGADIDTIIYASETLLEKRYYAFDTKQFCCDMELSRAFPMGLFGSECANAQTGMQLAADMIRAGRAHNILLVTTDLIPEHKGFSRVWPNVTVLSDAACSCIISDTAPAQGYELLSTAFWTNPALWNIDLSVKLLEYFKGIAQGVKRVGADVLKLAKGGEVSREQVQHVLVNNYNLSVVRTFVSQMGFELSQAYLKNLPRFAHSFAADGLINLTDLVSTGKVAPGHHCILLGSGTTAWAASLVKRIDGEVKVN